MRLPLPKWAKKIQKYFLALLPEHSRNAKQGDTASVFRGKMGQTPDLAYLDHAMPQPPRVGTDTQLQNLIDRSLKGDAAAHDQLLHHSCDRLYRLTRKMFHGFPQLRRWEQTDDVFQNSMLKLHRALCEVRVESVRHFFNLAAVQIRRELLDLGKHHFGPQGGAANHHTDGQPADEVGGSLHVATGEPQDLESWSEFHNRVECLSDEEQEIVNLVFYEGLSQEEAAKLLGMSFRTFKRRWQTVKVKLSEAIKSGDRG